MSKMIQIRHVPDDVHQKLRAKALQAHMTLSDFLLTEIRALAELPTWEQAFEQIEDRPMPRLRESSASAVRRERKER